MKCPHSCTPAVKGAADTSVTVSSSPPRAAGVAPAARCLPPAGCATRSGSGLLPAATQRPKNTRDACHRLFGLVIEPGLHGPHLHVSQHRHIAADQLQEARDAHRVASNHLCAARNRIMWVTPWAGRSGSAPRPQGRASIVTISASTRRIRDEVGLCLAPTLSG